jgi:UDP-glucose 4-epimerase
LVASTEKGIRTVIHPTQAPRSFRDSRCLVTGGGGFIGSNIVRELLEQGATVAVLDDFSTGRRENLPDVVSGLAVIEAELQSYPDLDQLVATTDYIFHLAAQVGNLKSVLRPEKDAESNILGSIRLFHASKGTGVRAIVCSSSSAVYGEAERLPIDEEHRLHPESFYGLSKLAAEKYASLAADLWGVPIVSLRYFNVFGYPMTRNEYSGVIPLFFERLMAGQDLVIYGDGQQSRDFVYVKDVVSANLLAAIHGRPGRAYNIGSGSSITILDLARAMMDCTGTESQIRFEQPRLGEVYASTAEIALARTDLRFEPAYDVRRGLAEIWARIQPHESTAGFRAGSPE